MKILSIETSCDDTGITLFETGGSLRKAKYKIIANALFTQKIHAQYGGVYPALAKSEHIKNLPILFAEVMKKAKIKGSSQDFAFLNSEGKVLIENPGIQAIAVTYGPGLEPSLWSGIVFAKNLAEKWKIPLIPVNHMEGHIFSVFGKGKGKFTIKLEEKKFPMLSLLASGGHTELVLIKDFDNYEIIGHTLDDAAGEAFDKVARMMGLPYPGGPKISKLAKKGRKMGNLNRFSISGMRRYIDFGSLGRRGDAGQRKFLAKNFRADKINVSSVPKISDFVKISLPRPMLKSPDFNFSFAGLKTAVLYLIKKIEPLDENKKRLIAAEFEDAVIETLIYKTAKAMKKYEAKSIIVGGGVAANKFLKKEMQKKIGKRKTLFPPKEITGDNSIMIGIAGYLQYLKKDGNLPLIENIKAEGDLKL